jgi:hypothetical protein
MAETTRKLRIFDNDVEVVDVPFEAITERFNEYELGDGSIIKVKAVATAVMRVKEQFTPDGDPIYIVVTNATTKVVRSPLTRPSIQLD